MAQKVSIDGLADEIARQLYEYTSEVKEQVSEAVEETAEEAKVELKVTSPKRTGKYAKSWRVKVVRGANISTAIVHNTLYQIVHLLEKGHAKRNGGRVAAIPHVGPAEDGARERLEQRIEKAIEEAR